MKSATSSALSRFVSTSSTILLISFATVVISTTSSCGSGSSSQHPKLSGNTAVTVMLSSTANDQLAEYDLPFHSITLTSQSGNTATLLAGSSADSSIGAEFLHLNGIAEPLANATIPQDVYTSATVTLKGGLFVCIALAPDNGQQVLDTSEYDQIGMPASDVTVTLPSPITVSGSSMALALNLQVSQSASYSACFTPNGISSFSITPNFTLTAPTGAANSKVMGLDGQISAISSNSLTLSLPAATGSRTLVVSSNSNTLYQGISGFSSLTVGTFVNLDGAIQVDGSVLATRVAVEDIAAADVVRGPLMEVTPSVSAIDMHAREQQGKDFPGYIGGFGPYKFDNATFQISGQMSNLGSLPFVPSFNASNMVPGQEVYISAASIPGSGYPTASTITLMPQTINGRIVASSQIGNFTDYTISLASYDLFPMLAVLPGQTTIENNPSVVDVYVDHSTQMLNTQALSAGNTMRFYGLVFNDNGNLRMDCSQVSDGVAFSAQSAANHPLKAGQTQTTRRNGSGSMPQIVSITTRRTP